MKKTKAYGPYDADDPRFMPLPEHLIDWCWVDTFMDYCDAIRSPQARAREIEQARARLDDLRETGA